MDEFAPIRDGEWGVIKVSLHKDFENEFKNYLGTLGLVN